MPPPLNPSITDSLRASLMVLFRTISRGSWDNLQNWHKALPGSRVEHVMKGSDIFAVHVPAGGAKEIAA